MLYSPYLPISLSPHPRVSPSAFRMGQLFYGRHLKINFVTFEDVTPFVSLQKWEKVYNCIRPHQALNYKTPLQFLKDNGIVSSDYPSLSHM